MAPNSLVAEINSLITTCTSLPKVIITLRAQSPTLYTTLTLLQIECSVTAHGLSQLGQALFTKPDLLDILSQYDEESVVYLSTSVERIALVFFLLDEELRKLDSGQTGGAGTEKLEELLGRIRQQGLCLCFLVGCMKVNCEPKAKVLGISSVAKSVLQQTHTRTKSTESRSKEEHGVQKNTESPRIVSGNQHNLLVDNQLSPNRPSKTKRVSTDRRKGEDDTPVKIDARYSGSTFVHTSDEVESHESEAIISAEIPRSEQLTGDRLLLHNAIIAAIGSGNVVNIKAAFKEALETRRISLSELESGNSSFLGEAIDAGSILMVQLLLEYGVDINAIAIHSVGYGALHLATSRNEIEIAKFLLKEGIDVTRRTTLYKETALFIACRKGLIEMVQLLSQKSGKTVLDTAGRESRTPLRTAIFEQSSEIVNALLEAGANVHLLDDHGYTPLHIAAHYGFVEIARSLIKHHASIDAKGAKDRTPLHVAAAAGHVTIVELLMEYGTELDARDSEHKTPLHLAARDGHLAAAQIMIEYGADLEAKDIDGWTHLHHATYKRRHDIMRLLLDSGALPDAKCKTGRTCLMRAAELDDAESIEILCKNHADTNITNDNSGFAVGFTALHFAAYEGSVNATRSLHAFSANIEQESANGSTSLMIAAKRGRLEIIKVLIAAKASINHQRSNKVTALHEAAAEDHVSVCEILIANGADVHSRNGDNQTPLMVAAKGNNAGVVRFLAKYGAIIDAQDNKSHFALYFAAGKGHVEAVEALLDEGASINIETANGATALHRAAYNGHSNVVKVLLARGAERKGTAKHKNPQGTPADAARLGGFEDIAKMIEAFKSDPGIKGSARDEHDGM